MLVKKSVHNILQHLYKSFDDAFKSADFQRELEGEYSLQKVSGLAMRNKLLGRNPRQLRDQLVCAYFVFLIDLLKILVLAA